MQIYRAIAAGCVGFVYGLGVWFLFLAGWGIYYLYKHGTEALTPQPTVPFLGGVCIVNLIVMWHYARRFYNANNT